MVDSPDYHSDSTAVDKPSPRSSRSPRAARRQRGTAGSGQNERSFVRVLLKLVYSVVHGIVYPPLAWVGWLFYQAYQLVIRSLFASGASPVLLHCGYLAIC